MSKRRYSPTQIAMFLRCPEQWRRRYIEGERRPPGIAAHLGSGIHAGAAVNYSEKIKTGTEIKVDDFCDIAGDRLKERALEDDYTIDEGEDKKKLLSTAIDKIPNVAKHFIAEVSPPVQPKEVEKEVLIEGANYNLYGFIDLVTIENIIDDLKTGARLKSISDVQRSLQLTHYAILHNVTEKKFPVKVRLTSITTAVKPKSAKLEGVRTLENVQAYLNVVDKVNEIIQSGLFAPTLPDNWWCSEKFCGYWKDCKYR